MIWWIDVVILFAVALLLGVALSVPLRRWWYTRRFERSFVQSEVLCTDVNGALVLRVRHKGGVSPQKVLETCTRIASASVSFSQPDWLVTESGPVITGRIISSAVARVHGNRAADALWTDADLRSLFESVLVECVEDLDISMLAVVTTGGDA